jgi:hypothetical protein
MSLQGAADHPASWYAATRCATGRVEAPELALAG